MNPQTLKRLQTNPDYKELVEYLMLQASELNSLNFELPLAPTDIATEILGRKRAYETLVAMLGPLVEGVDKPVGSDPTDYVV